MKPYEVDEESFVETLPYLNPNQMHFSHIQKTFRRAWRIIKKYRDLNADLKNEIELLKKMACEDKKLCEDIAIKIRELIWDNCDVSTQGAMMGYPVEIHGEALNQLKKKKTIKMACDGCRYLKRGKYCVIGYNHCIRQADDYYSESQI